MIFLVSHEMCTTWKSRVKVKSEKLQNALNLDRPCIIISMKSLGQLCTQLVCSFYLNGKKAFVCYISNHARDRRLYVKSSPRDIWYWLLMPNHRALPLRLGFEPGTFRLRDHCSTTEPSRFFKCIFQLFTIFTLSPFSDNTAHSMTNKSLKNTVSF